MNVYVIIKQSAFGNNKAIESIWTTIEEASDEIIRLVREQERYDNHYYLETKEVKGDIFGIIKNSRILEKYHEETQLNIKLIERLKVLAQSIQSLDIDQPSTCLFGYGDCGYPINDCHNCPMHSWSDFTLPLTTCEFK